MRTSLKVSIEVGVSMQRGANHFERDENHHAVCSRPLQISTQFDPPSRTNFIFFPSYLSCLLADTDKHSGWMGRQPAQQRY